MVNLTRTCSRTLVSILALSLLVVGAAEASVAKPEVTANLSSYIKSWPAVIETDPYTGETVTRSPAAQMEIKCITVNIKNEPFTPYKDSEGNQIELFYEVRVKGHFEEGWVVVDLLKPTDYDLTQPTYTLGQFAERDIFRRVTPGGQLDFQVQKYVGYLDPDSSWILETEAKFHGEKSGWSDTATVTIDDATATQITASPTEQPQAPSPTVTPTEHPIATPAPTPLAPNMQTEAATEPDIWQVATVALLSAVVILVVALVIQRSKGNTVKETASR